MKELEFLEKINEIDPALLEEQSPARGKSLRKVLRVAAVAAVLALVLAGTVYAISRSGRVELNRIATADEAGFEAKVELPLVPWDSFQGEIREAGERIVQQYENYVPQPAWSSYYEDPGQFTRQFDSLDKAVAYVGLPDLKTPTFPFDTYDCTVTACGDETGKVREVRISARHIERNDIGAQETVTLLTDAAPRSEYVSGGVWTYEFPRDVEFQHYTTSGGNDCAIAALRPEYDSSHMGLTGYVTVGSALYELNLGAVPREKYDVAMQILHDWAEALD